MQLQQLPLWIRSAARLEAGRDAGETDGIKPDVCEHGMFDGAARLYRNTLGPWRSVGALGRSSAPSALKGWGRQGNKQLAK